MGKDEGKGRRWYEAGTLMARDVSEKYQSQIRLPLEHLDIPVACNVSDKCFCTGSSHLVTYTRQANNHPIQPAFLKPLKYLVTRTIVPSSSVARILKVKALRLVGRTTHSTTHCHIPEKCNLLQYRHENLNL